MSNYQNPHDDNTPRFEPWLGAIATSFLPWGAAFYLPKVRELINAFFDKQLKGKDVKVGLLSEDDVSIPKAPGREPAK